MKNWNFRFQPLGGATKLFFQPHYRDKKAEISYPTHFQQKNMNWFGNKRKFRNAPSARGNPILSEVWKKEFFGQSKIM